MDILKEVKKIVLELSMVDEIDGQNLREDYGLDSLGITNLIIKVEEVFGIEISLDLLVDMNLNTIEDVCEIVRKSSGE